MANIYTLKSGLASDPTVWSGGVVPTQGDRVLISNGFTVELDGDYTWGDGTTTSITINGVNTISAVYINSGTIKFSRTKDSSLTIYGAVQGAGNGKIDMGREADPIPAAYKATLILAAGATANTAQFQNTIYGFSSWGQDKTRYAKVASAASNSVFTIATPTNWNVGDWLYFSASSVPGSSATYTDVRAIQSIVNNGNGTSTITLAAATAYNLTNARYVVNLNRNVMVRAWQGNLYGANLTIAGSVTAPDSSLEIGPTEFRIGGSSSTASNLACGLTFASTADSKIVKIQDFVCHNVWDVSGSTVTPISIGQYNVLGGFTMAGGSSITKPVTRPTVAFHAASLGSATTQRGFMSYGSDSRTVVNGAFFGCPCVYTATSGVVDMVLDRPLIVNAGVVANGNVNSAATISGGKMVGYYGCIVPFTGANYLFNTLVFDGVDFVGGANEPTSYSAAPAFFVPTANQNFRIEFRNCTLPANWSVARTMNYDSLSNRSYLDITAPTSDATAAYRYTRGGRTMRDTANRKRGTSSIALSCWYAANAQVRSTTFTLPAGVTAEIRGSVKLSPTYGTNMPVISVSSAYTDTVSTTVQANSSSWTDYSLSVTNPTGNPVTFTLTYTAQSSASTEAAIAYFDGVPDYPFVDTVRHFGYVFDMNIYRTPDPKITMSETAALALPVVIDHTAKTITVNGAVTSAQVYQACIADLCQTANIAKAIHISSADGSDFTTTYTVVNRANVAGAFTDATGRAVVISAPALISGSRVQVYNATTGVELYNGVLASAGLSVPVTYAGNHIIRLRAEHSTKLPLQTIGVLSSSGVSFLDVQQEDTVYINAGIDGSEVTEFSADGPNIQIDINDPDGITTVQRLYAWMQHYQTTEEGVRSVFFGAMAAIDAANFVIDQALVDMKLDNVSALPLRVVGGYLARKDGSTVIAANSNSIQMDPSKAYAVSVSGGGGTAVVDSAAIASAVRANLSTELARLDVPVSTRSTLKPADIPAGLSAADVWAYGTRSLTGAAGMTPAQEAKIDAIKSKVDPLPARPASEGTLEQIQTKIDATL